MNKDAGIPVSHSARLPRRARAGQTLLNVALYPYVPRPAQFEAVVQQAWNAQYPGVDLNFVHYDCYYQDPPPGLDVFAFDTTFLSYFVAQGYLRPIPQDQINDWTGLWDFALAACKIDDTCYAIPYLGCVTTLFYRAGDTAVANALSLDALYQVLGNSLTPNNPQPPPGQGLLIDFTGGTTDACLYLQTSEEINDQYPLDPYLPPANQLDPHIIGNLQTFTKMAGVAQASYVDPGQNRVNWFVQGLGRALVGVTETLCSFPPAAVGTVGLQVLPLDVQRISQPFYTDGMGIDANISPDKVEYALALANLIASEMVLYESLIPDQPGNNPQFLIPSRGEVIANLMDQAPQYGAIAAILLNHVRQPFRIGPQSRPWLNATKGAIRSAILNVPGVDAITDEMFDDSEPPIEEKSRAVHLFSKK